MTLRNPKYWNAGLQTGIVSRRQKAGLKTGVPNHCPYFGFSIIFALCLIAVLPMSAVARAGDGGSSAAEFLRIGTGARAPARGDAVTADPQGVLSLHYNPAGLANVERGEIEGMYQEAVLGMGHGSFGFVHPIGANAGWGVGAKYMDYGRTQRTTISTVLGVSTLNNAGTFKGNDLAAGLSYGYRIADVSVGITGKYITAKYDDVTAGAGAVDLGILWKSSSIPVALGATIQNVGSRMKFMRTREHLPLLGRVGAAWTPMDGMIRLTTDIEWARNEEPVPMAGLEFTPVSFITLRAGYDGRNDLGRKWSVGGGFRHNDFTLDYAFIPSGKIGDNHRFALGIQFGPGRKIR
jgi:hypothetical protein